MSAEAAEIQPRFVESSKWREIVKEPEIDLEDRPVGRMVITGYGGVGPLGDTRSTWNKMIQGISGVREFNLLNHAVKIAAPLPDDYDPDIRLTRDEKHDGGMSRVAKMATSTAREALEMAQVRMNSDGRVDDPWVNNDESGSYIGSGVADTHRLINIGEHLHRSDHLFPRAGEDSEEGRSQRQARDLAIIQASKRVRPGWSLQTFPEEVNGRVAMGVGASGSGTYGSEACATGASMMVRLFEDMRSGKVQSGLGGGFEDALYNRPEVTAAVFAALRALSTRNSQPEQASRPLDANRDGFIMAAGGGVVYAEPLETALARGATIHAEVLGFAKSMDANQPTELSPRRVAKTILKALWLPHLQALMRPDAAFLHATSTQVGDKAEIAAFRMAFGDDLRDIPLTAIKSMLGHLFGGAGAVNVVNAIIALSTNKIPRVLNYTTPDPEIMRHGELSVVQDTLDKQLNVLLATAYGFGGYNAVIVLGKYLPNNPLVDPEYRIKAAA